MKAHYKIVNGPQHGETLVCDTAHRDGTIVNQRYVPETLPKYDDDTDIRFIHPTFNRRFLILGGGAYYLGEEIVGLTL